MKSWGKIGTEQARVIIDQLISAQEQLQFAGICHNDIKPRNILIDEHSEGQYKVYVGDFGQANQLGGTPGWTPPEFIDERIPGVSDMYSFGLVMLYILCEDAGLFYAIRDNFIYNEDFTENWYTDFLKLSEMKMICFMTRTEPNDRILINDLKYNI